MTQFELFSADEIESALRDYPKDSIDLFRKYHAEHPEIYRIFERFSLMMFRAGRTRYGAKGIMERIRWDRAMDYPDEELKSAIASSPCIRGSQCFATRNYNTFFLHEKLRESENHLSAPMRFFMGEINGRIIGTIMAMNLKTEEET